MFQPVFSTIVDEITFGQNPVGMMGNTKIGSAVPDVNNTFGVTRLMEGMVALAMSALLFAVRVGIGEFKFPASFACLNEAIGVNGNRIQSIALQNRMNGVIQTITDNVQIDIELANGFGKPGEKRIDMDLFQAVVEFIKTGIQQSNLTAHAFSGAYFSCYPVIFHLFVTIHAKTLQQGVGYIAGADGIVEVAQYKRLCRFTSQCGNRNR